MKKLHLVLVLIISLSTVGGIGYKAYGHFAKAEYVAQLAMRLDNKITQDKIDKIQERLWALEDRYGSFELMPQSVKEEYRLLLEIKERLTKQVGGVER